MRIFLTGFMGSGKSYTGLELARKLGRPFVDLDQWIEDMQGLSINEIFSEQGEDAFRRLEAETLRTFEKLPYFIMATGGGAPCFHDNISWMNENGMTIFIDPPVTLLVERLEEGREQRPLLHGQENLSAFISQKMEDRRPYYEQAHVHLRPAKNTDVPGLLANQITNIIGH
jgi:shikimate kinase